MVTRTAFAMAFSAAVVVGLTTAGVPVSGEAGGTIVGRIKYTGPTPVNSIIRLGADPRCAKLYAGRQARGQTFTVAPDGGFADVLVTIDGSLPATAVPAAPAVLTQKNCQFTPHVLAARIGQTLEVRNDDPTEHNTHAASTLGNQINTTQPINGPPAHFTLKAGELLHVRCDNHPWMSAYIAIVDNPYFAVSGTDGTFTIANVPPGRQTLKAWHEVMGMQTQTIDVQAGKTTTVEFTFAPHQAAAGAPAVHELLVPHAGALVPLIASR
jgi:hypothetical protein